MTIAWRNMTTLVLHRWGILNSQHKDAAKEFVRKAAKIFCSAEDDDDDIRGFPTEH